MHRYLIPYYVKASYTDRVCPNTAPTTTYYTLSLPDALPISLGEPDGARETGAAGEVHEQHRRLLGDRRGDPRRQRARIAALVRSEEHTSELQSLTNLVCRLPIEKKKVRKSV